MLTPLTPAQVAEFELEEAGVRDGSSPNESLEVDSSRATRRYRCLWQKRHEVARYFVGEVAAYDDSGDTKISRLIPQRHPELHGLFATKITSIKGHKWEDETPADHTGYNEPVTNEYHHAEIEVLFEHVPYTVLTDDEATMMDGEPEMSRYVEYPCGDPQGGGDYVQLPGAVMRYVPTDETEMPVVPFNTGKIVPQETFQVCWHRLPEEAWTPESTLYRRVYFGLEDDAGVHGTEAIAFFGCINDAEFLGRPKGTVLFNNVVPKRRKSPTGEGFEWDIIFEFIFKPSGWNWLYYWGLEGAEKPNDWYFVGKGANHYYSDTVPDNYSLYNARDLNRLFRLY